LLCRRGTVLGPLFHGRNGHWANGIWLSATRDAVEDSSIGKPWKIQCKDWPKRNEGGFRGDTEDIEAVGASIGEEYEVFGEKNEA
jgi:hypothetical protein